MSRSAEQAVPLLLDAYRRGLFPMADGREGGFERVSFYEVARRSIIPLDDAGLTIPRSLRATIRKSAFELSFDTDFPAVIRACADTRVDGNWINDWIIDAYAALHRAGHAHSVEARLNNRLVGGLYGVHIGSAFFGESMFSRPDLGGTNASKVCLVHLWNHLRTQGFTLLDTQIANDHMKQFGIVEIARARYHKLLSEAVSRDASWLSP